MKPLFTEKEFILSSDKPTDTQTVAATWNNFIQQDMRCDSSKCELVFGDNGLTVFTDGTDKSRVYLGIVLSDVIHYF